MTFPALAPRKRKTPTLPAPPPGHKPPPKKRKRYDSRPGTVQRGMTICLHPHTVSNESAAGWQRQKQVFDLWRHSLAPRNLSSPVRPRVSPPSRGAMA
jgi:hypothetical protein